MATELTVATTDRAGTVLSDLEVSADAGGNFFSNDGNVLLKVKNTDSGSHTITMVTTATVDGQAVGDRSFALAAGKEVILGPFKQDVYNDADDDVQITFSAVTGMKLLAFRPGAGSV